MPDKAKHRKLLGETIRARRKELKLTQEKLAEKADLSTVFISRLEHGKDTVSIDTLKGLAAALNTTIECLVKGM